MLVIKILWVLCRYEQVLHVPLLLNQREVGFFTMLLRIDGPFRTLVCNHEAQLFHEQRLVLFAPLGPCAFPRNTCFRNNVWSTQQLYYIHIIYHVYFCIRWIQIYFLIIMSSEKYFIYYFGFMFFLYSNCLFFLHIVSFQPL